MLVEMNKGGGTTAGESTIDSITGSTTKSVTVSKSTSDWWILSNTHWSSYMADITVKVNGTDYNGWKTGTPVQIGAISSNRACYAFHVPDKPLSAGDTIELKCTSVNWGVGVILCNQ